MRRILWLIALCALAYAGNSSAAESAAPWRVGRPVVAYFNSFVFPNSGGYWDADYDPTTLTAQIAQQAVAGGFNLVWINDLSQLAIAEKYGLRAQLVISGHQPQNDLFFHPASNWPNAADVPAINALIDGFKASAAAYSYYIIDEPMPARFPRLAAIVAYLRERDPAHLAYIDLWPPDAAPSAFEAPDYTTYLAQFIATVKPSLLSYNSYNLFEGNDRGLFLSNMQTIAAAAKKTGVPFMPVVQGSAFDVGWRLPNTNELRFLANTSLAFGAQGIFYFHYWTPFGPKTGGIAAFPDGKPTSVYTSLQSINPLFERYATQLQGLQWIGTYVKGYRATMMPRNTQQLPPHAAFDIPALRDKEKYFDGQPLQGVLLGYFGSAATSVADASHVFVANLSYRSVKKYRVRGPAPLSVFDPNKRSWSAVPTHYVDVTLQPGGGVLIARTQAKLTSE
jgi:hypothetical protein